MVEIIRQGGSKICRGTFFHSENKGKVQADQDRQSLRIKQNANSNDEDQKESRKVRTTLAFLVGMEGGPWSVFRVTLDSCQFGLCCEERPMRG